MGQKKGTENRVVTDALGAIAHEILDQLATVDYFVVAVGNGSSILGPGRVFKQKTGEKNTREFTIVGSEEADMTKGKISHKSPLGEALFGAKVGDIVKVVSPNGEVEYKINEIR